MKKEIIELLKNREAGTIAGIEIHANEIDVYFHDEVPAENEIDYNHIAEYIINANQ